MATYNGSIKVLPCDEINIPQPGILVKVASDSPAIATGGMVFVRDLLGTNDRLEITTDSTDLYDLFINQKISGSDVIYINQTAGVNSGKSYPLEITSVGYDFDPFFGGIKVITLFVRRTVCSPPVTENIEWIPAKGVGSAFDIEIYRGNYSTTTGIVTDLDGYSGAGNSDGYALSLQEAGVLANAVEVLTVNNDKVPLVITPIPQELKVVKVFCDGAPGGGCSAYDEGGGYDSNMYAFSFEF